MLKLSLNNNNNNNEGGGKGKNAETFLEPARIFLCAAAPGHPGDSTFAGYLWSAAIHHLDGILYGMLWMWWITNNYTIYRHLKL